MLLFIEFLYFIVNTRALVSHDSAGLFSNFTGLLITTIIEKPLIKRNLQKQLEYPLIKLIVEKFSVPKDVSHDAQHAMYSFNWRHL